MQTKDNPQTNENVKETPEGAAPELLEPAKEAVKPPAITQKQADTAEAPETEEAAAPVVRPKAPVLTRGGSTRQVFETEIIPVVNPGDPGIPVECAYRVAQETTSRPARAMGTASQRVQRLIEAEFTHFVVRVIDDESNKLEAGLTDRYNSVQIECYGNAPGRVDHRHPISLRKQSLLPNQRIATFTAAMANYGTRAGGVLLSRALPRGTTKGQLVLNVPTKQGNNPDWNKWTGLESILSLPLRIGNLFNVDGEINEVGADLLEDEALDDTKRAFIEWLCTDEGKSTASVLATAHEVLVNNARERAATGGNQAPDLAGPRNDLGLVDIDELD